MKTRKRNLTAQIAPSTRDALIDQLALAANRIIAQAYDIDLFRWDAKNVRSRRQEDLRNGMMNDSVVAFGPAHGELFVFADPQPSLWQCIKRWFA